MSTDGPFDTKAAAKFIGMSRSWLEKTRVRGDGPLYRKQGASVRYYRGDLETWLASKGRTSTAEYERKSSHTPQVKPAKSEPAHTFMERQLRPMARFPVRAERIDDSWHEQKSRPRLG
jgi:predicted DNA-binding transcriptional regulator AlpA